MRRLFSLFLAGLLLAGSARAHSGKARFHAIIDTDCAADDLRTLCMLLGNREVEVLAVATSEGALTPEESARRVAALLRGFWHEGIPVGAGRGSQVAAPAWRSCSERVNWGEAADGPLPPAGEVIDRALTLEEEPVTVVALGALTNWADLRDRRPDLRRKIARIVWYDDDTPGGGANYRADTTAARRVLACDVPVEIVSVDPAVPMAVTPSLLDSVASVGTAYARKIVATHREAPLAELVGAGHLKVWDDLVAVYLFRPELFARRPQSGRIVPTASPEVLARAVTGILRGRPDSESRVFYGFPVESGLYAADVEPIVAQTIALHGPSEWRAGVLTNELHGHLGIYAIVGVKMGIRAREYFAIGVDDIQVVSAAGCTPPVSCLNDGLQVATGATLGYGLIGVVGEGAPRPEATFRFRDKTIRLTLRPEYAERIRRDVATGVERFGGLTEDYWQYVRGLALQYWLDFDRHRMFELREE